MILLTMICIFQEIVKLAFYSSDIDECSSSPCDNGGTCSDFVDGYTCTCDAGYTGTHCETGQSRRDATHGKVKQQAQRVDQVLI